jgi:hypothetical protein
MSGKHLCYRFIVKLRFVITYVTYTEQDIWRRWQWQTYTVDKPARILERNTGNWILSTACIDVSTYAASNKFQRLNRNLIAGPRHIHGSIQCSCRENQRPDARFPP